MKRRFSFCTALVAVLHILGMILISDLLAIRLLLCGSVAGRICFWMIAAVLYLWAVLAPLPGLGAPKRLGALARGRFLLCCFAWLSLLNSVGGFFGLFLMAGQSIWYRLAHWLLGQLLLTPVLFGGILRAAARSARLRIRQRVLLLLFWWLPGLNFWIALGVARRIGREYFEEWDREEWEQARAESAFCRTRYPILMVHGVFFRDQRFFNYWGRIPATLKRNGASVYYGEQRSAATVAECGKELQQRIEAILQETGSEKVNIIAHSKGGLDSRYCISALGMGEKVASLTTVNTPHRGCAFADYLLKKAPVQLRRRIANSYNTALAHLGEKDADFLGAVSDLTVERCTAFNEAVPDNPEVWYQSITSRMKNHRSAPFPLNWTFLLVKAFSRENDGLVDTRSAIWGARHQLLEPKGRRGIGHGDVIDLWRENIPGFDVREFYAELVHDLQQRGY